MAEPLGPFLNIDGFLDRAKERINLVGVELEGGWFSLPKGNLRPERDGSIKFDLATDRLSLISQILYPGEIPLPPLGPKEFPLVMKLYYPHYVNATCGMHVHLSLNKVFTYQRLMVNHPYSYPGTVVEYIKRWATREGLAQSHPIWGRLRGENEFCQHVFQADEQARTDKKDYDHHRPGHRYTVVSYCWSRYKTLECRLLPMMETANQGIQAVQELMRITNAFLAATKDREPRRHATVMDPGDLCVEEKRSYV